MPCGTWVVTCVTAAAPSASVAELVAGKLRKMEGVAPATMDWIRDPACTPVPVIV